MPVKFNLYSEDTAQYPNILGFHNQQMMPFIGRKIILDGDVSKVYTVGYSVVGAFVDILPCLDTFDTTFNVTSVKFNGVEYLGSPESVTIPNNDNPSIYQAYFDSWQVHNNNYWLYELAPLGIPNELESIRAGFFLFLKNLLETQLNLPVLVGKVHPNYFENTEATNLDGESPVLHVFHNIMIEKQHLDSIEITYNYHNSTDTICSAVEFNDLDIVWSFNGLEISQTIDGVVPYADKPYSWNFDSMVPTAAESRKPSAFDPDDVVTPSYNTDSEFDCVTCETECDALSFTDTSTINNTFPGHQVFGYRLIRLIRPDGTAYEYSSASSDDPDQLIGVLSNGGINTFSYSFLDTDTDGVWSVQVYNFPEWDEDVLYNHLLGIIVHKGDKIYQCIQSNVGVDPETDVDGAYWVEYAITEDTLNTRYGSVAFKAVLCISLIGCYKKLIEDAFCSEKSDPCSNLCDNQKFQNAMKIRVVWDAIKSSSCRNDWNEVKNQIDIWKNLCNCVNC